MADAFRKMQLQANMMSEDMQRKFQAFVEQQKIQNEQSLAQLNAQIEAFKQQKKMEETVVKGHMDKEQSVVDAITTLKVAEKQATENHAGIVLQGFVDQMLKAQEAQKEQILEYQKHLQNLAETLAAPRELVKDPKTGKKTVRIKKEG